jgi:galactokinase
MNSSHASLRDLYQVSCPELDVLQEISVSQPGVWGCRMTGGGFGGCVIALVQSESLREYLDRAPDLYRQAAGQEPFFLVVEPRGGAEKIAD